MSNPIARHARTTAAALGRWLTKIGGPGAAAAEQPPEPTPVESIDLLYTRIRGRVEEMLYELERFKGSQTQGQSLSISATMLNQNLGHKPPRIFDIPDGSVWMSRERRDIYILRSSDKWRLHPVVGDSVVVVNDDKIDTHEFILLGIPTTEPTIDVDSLWLCVGKPSLGTAGADSKIDSAITVGTTYAVGAIVHCERNGEKSRSMTIRDATGKSNRPVEALDTDLTDPARFTYLGMSVSRMADFATPVVTKAPTTAPAPASSPPLGSGSDQPAPTTQNIAPEKPRPPRARAESVWRRVGVGESGPFYRYDGSTVMEVAYCADPIGESQKKVNVGTVWYPDPDVWQCVGFEHYTGDSAPPSIGAQPWRGWLVLDKVAGNGTYVQTGLVLHTADMSQPAFSVVDGGPDFTYQDGHPICVQAIGIGVEPMPNAYTRVRWGGHPPCGMSATGRVYGRWTVPPEKVAEGAFDPLVVPLEKIADHQPSKAESTPASTRTGFDLLRSMCAAQLTATFGKPAKDVTDAEVAAWAIYSGVPEVPPSAVAPVAKQPTLPTLLNPLEFLDRTGLLVEMNRLVLHPLGLMLVVRGSKFGILDARLDPDGLSFDEASLAEGQKKLAAYLAEHGGIRLTRRSRLGYVVQPVAEGSIDADLILTAADIEYRIGASATSALAHVLCGDAALDDRGREYLRATGVEALAIVTRVVMKESWSAYPNHVLRAAALDMATALLMQRHGRTLGDTLGGISNGTALATSVADRLASGR